jgi:hypothetical protein
LVNLTGSEEEERIHGIAIGVVLISVVYSLGSG